jgi:hypothetical protein
MPASSSLGEQAIDASLGQRSLTSVTISVRVSLGSMCPIMSPMISIGTGGFLAMPRSTPMSAC